MRGNLLETEAGGRAVVLSFSPWVFLSRLWGSRHNLLNWFSLIHIRLRGDFFSPVLWGKGSKDFPLLPQQMKLFLFSALSF